VGSPRCKAFGLRPPTHASRQPLAQHCIIGIRVGTPTRTSAGQRGLPRDCQLKNHRQQIATVGLVALSLWAPAGICVAQTPASPAVRAAAARPQPGDRVFLHIVGEPELSDTVTVNERGEVAFPKLGVVNIAGFTIAALQDTVRARYAVILRNPAVEVVLLRRVAVQGAVTRSNMYLVDVSATLRDVIALAGGISDEGDRGKVFIVREGTRVHVPEWESDASLASDLRSGDQIVVGRRAWWKSNIFSLTSTAVLIASFAISLSR
jgi:protein involved in polysaccharide export with SLBB domain